MFWVGEVVDEKDRKRYVLAILKIVTEILGENYLHKLYTEEMS